MGLGATNKRKGSNGERYYATVFKEMGFEHCKTARYGSRSHDDAGIDLINLPINVQIKTGKHKGMKPDLILSDIKERIAKDFPKTDNVHDNPLILIHRMEGAKGRKRTEMEDMVHMSFNDFKKLLDKIVWE